MVGCEMDRVVELLRLEQIASDLAEEHRLSAAARHRLAGPDEEALRIHAADLAAMQRRRQRIEPGR